MKDAEPPVSLLLVTDAAINLLLGVLLALFPGAVIEVLGLPRTGPPFYASLLGGVLVGVGLALLIEARRPTDGAVGLGLGGAIAINLCGGLTLALWLVAGRLEVPQRGRAAMWALVGVLVVVSLAELLGHRARRGGSSAG